MSSTSIIQYPNGDQRPNTSGEPLLVALLGTSLTASGGWAESLAHGVESLSHRRVTLLNCAVPGATSRTGLKLTSTVERAGADIVLIEYAINDAALYRYISVAESARNHAIIIQRLHAAKDSTRLYLMTTNPAIGWRRLTRPFLTRYYDLYPLLATREHTGLIDNRPHWAGLPHSTKVRALPDGLHPAPEFSKQITLTNALAGLAQGLRPNERHERP